MRRLCALVAFVLTISAGAACSSGDSEEKDAASAVCPAPAAAIATSGLPAGFPAPAGVHYTATSTAGPTTVVEGFSTAELGAVFTGYKTALGQQPYSVTKSEKDAHDAEVNFAGTDTTGQVALSEPCKGRTGVKVTVRPK